jgi:hypothetical protein
MAALQFSRISTHTHRAARPGAEFFNTKGPRGIAGQGGLEALNAFSFLWTSFLPGLVLRQGLGYKPSPLI